ncbi:hypothetical protein M3D92_08555 [Micrococcus terreus]|uniref:lipopolysaccharide biosynthesis protein n=1 Tax=Micrococcus terreus TaxID=574650 RepID=UPI0021A7D4E6|nr:hypothetical protein [Micrococcus terreus]MCT2089340.1 hypothetical protein [Micrococcus terreus]
MLSRLASVAGTRVLSSLLQGVMLLVLTAALGPVHFGQFASVLVMCGILSSAFGFGSGTLALRLGNGPDVKGSAGSIAALRYPSALVAGAVTFLLGTFVLGFSHLPLMWAATLMGLAEAAGLVVEAILFGQRKTRRAQASMVVRRAATLAAAVIGYFAYQVYTSIIVASAALLVLSAFWLIGCVGRPQELRSVVKASLPFWGADMLSKLQSTDVVLATVVLSPTGAGIFAAASRITSPLNILASSMMSVFTPEMVAASPADRRRIFSTSRRYMTFACIGIITMGPVFGWALEWLLGEDYRGVFWPVVILCIGTGLAALSQSYISYLYAIDKAGLVFRTRAWTIPVSLVSGVLLAMAFGPVGMAAVLVVSQGLLTLRIKAYLNALSQSDH